MKWPLELKKEGENILKKIDFQNVSPGKELALRFFDLDPGKLKIVILGQDPYPTPGVANGRAFAVEKNAEIPQSLKNIFKELLEFKGFYSTDRTLEHWENQGVLLLNTAFTVEHFKPNSHRDIWLKFSQKLIFWLSNNLELTWVLWGGRAKSFKKYINDGNIIEDAHPSPLSYYRRDKKTFFKLKNIDW